MIFSTAHVHQDWTSKPTGSQTVLFTFLWQINHNNSVRAKVSSSMFVRHQEQKNMFCAAEGSLTSDLDGPDVPVRFSQFFQLTLTVQYFHVFKTQRLEKKGWKEQKLIRLHISPPPLVIKEARKAAGFLRQIICFVSLSQLFFTIIFLFSHDSWFPLPVLYNSPLQYGSVPSSERYQPRRKK